MEVAPNILLKVFALYLNMFAKFDEISAMTLQDFKETKRYGWTDGRT